MATDKPIEAGLWGVLKEAASAFKFLSDISDLVSDNFDIETPLYVRNRPSDAQIEKFVMQIFRSKDLLREGVLIAPMVYARKNKLGQIVGDAVLLRVEGVGSSPTKAMLSSRFLTPTDQVKALDQVFHEHFASEIEILTDRNYERVPDRERGIFLKLKPNGEFSRRSDYRNIRVEELRRDADRIASFMNGLASVEEKALADDLARRIVYYDQVIDAIEDRLIAQGVMEHIARAQRLHDESRQLLIEAQKNFDKAARWGNAVAITQWIGMGLQAASIVRTEFVQSQAKAEMASAFSRLEAGQQALGQRFDAYNERLNNLNSLMQQHATQMSPLGEMMNSLQGVDVFRFYYGFGIEGFRSDGTGIDVRYFEDMRIP